MISIRDVTVKFGNKIALRDIDLAVGKGELLGIVGPNGGGKSTLLRVILGMVKPTQGEVRVLGQEPKRIRHRIGYVPQFKDIDRCFPMLVEDVVMLGRVGIIGPGRRPTREDWAIVERSMKETGILHMRKEPIGHLSGGERQKAFIARALATEGEILLFDEPELSLDPPSQAEIFAFIKSLHRRAPRTILVVSHDIRFLHTFVDRMICLNKTIISDGPPEEVLSKEALCELYSVNHIPRYDDHG